MSELILNNTCNGMEICVLENNQICELYVCNENKENIMGNIYLGKVRNVVDGMQAAFVDIGMEKNAFISIKDAIPKVDITKNEQIIDFKISEVLKENDKILVQVKKTPTQEKGARVSTHITIPGNYIVLMPNVNIITISQKISEDFEKKRLITIVKKSLPSNFGAIIRTDAKDITEEKIIEDIDELLNQWKKIENEWNLHDDICLLYNEHEMLSTIKREFINQKLKKIHMNDDICFEKIKEYMNQRKNEDKIELNFVENEDLFEKFGLITERKNILNRKVWLKCGGYIVIDRTEALTAIDVNSGKYVGKNNLEQTALEVNIEAAKEIMKQIRLKDIGGIIVIDYIDLSKKEDQRKIIEIMNNEAQNDRSKIDIKGYTELNLVELTRKMVNI